LNRRKQTQQRVVGMASDKIPIEKGIKEISKVRIAIRYDEDPSLKLFSASSATSC
jgi:hypothetical protein